MSDVKKSREFERLYNKYYTPMLRYILKRVSSIPQAEDLTMEIFAACWEKYDTFDPERASFATWLYTAANNRLKNFYRDRKNTEEIDETSAVDLGFEDEIIRAEYLTSMRAQLAEALSKLNDTQRRIVIMKYFRNMNSNDIGSELGLSPVNVRVQLSRTMKKLAELLEQQTGEHFE